MERVAVVTTSPTILQDEDPAQLRLVLTVTGGVIGIPYNPALLTDQVTANGLADQLRLLVPGLTGTVAKPNPGEQLAFDKDSTLKPYVFVFPDGAVVPVAAILSTKPAGPCHPVVNGHEVTWVSDVPPAVPEVPVSSSDGGLGAALQKTADNARAAAVDELSDHRMIAEIYAAVVKK